MKRPVLLLLAALGALLAPSQVHVAAARLPCTDPAFVNQYNAIRAKMSACEAVSGVVMVLPLGKKQKEHLCEKCPDLQVMAQEGLQPRCTVESRGEQILLRGLFRRLFRPCIDSSSASDSGSSGDMGNAAPGTTPTATTNTTPKIGATTAPSAAIKSLDANSSSEATGDGSPMQTSEAQNASSMSAGTIVGIVAGGVVAVLVAIIFLLVRRRRQDRHYSSDKMEEADLESSTGRASTIHYQFSLASGSTGARSSKKSGRSGASGSSGASLAPSSVLSTPSRVNAWEDPVIVAARISKDKVMSTVLVSRGGFGEVYRGIYNRQPVAIKTLLPDKRKDMDEINAAVLQMVSLGRLRVQFTTEDSIPEMVAN
ncbi:hypothetical protein PybrP1_001938 [[Pythium] brassicae (nom. inval.)]|nr:hypothetical protein PybrP1_001938 [[Pythium] brassicae (nom. inval.)]